MYKYIILLTLSLGCAIRGHDEVKDLLHTAVNNGSIDLLRKAEEKALKHDIDFTNIINQKLFNDRTALHIATKNGFDKIVRQLLKKKANPNLHDNQGITPLHSATPRGYYNITQLLINHGANINITNETGNTPLHLATAHGNYDITQLLINNDAHVNIQDEDGNTPLHLAVSQGYYKLVQLLINNDAHINVQDRYGDTPLHLAVLHDHRDVAQLLINNGANINTTDNDDNTPLHLAAFHGNYKLVQILISNDANPTPSRTKYLAATQGNDNIIIFFNNILLVLQTGNINQPILQTGIINQLINEKTSQDDIADYVKISLGQGYYNSAQKLMNSQRVDQEKQDEIIFHALILAARYTLELHNTRQETDALKRSAMQQQKRQERAQVLDFIEKYISQNYLKQLRKTQEHVASDQMNNIIRDLLVKIQKMKKQKQKMLAQTKQPEPPDEGKSKFTDIKITTQS